MFDKRSDSGAHDISIYLLEQFYFHKRGVWEFWSRFVIRQLYELQFFANTHNLLLSTFRGDDETRHVGFYLKDTTPQFFCYNL